MGYIRGSNRNQVTLFPESLDDYIPADHLVRVIDAFIDRQDLRLLKFQRAVAADTGRPGYDPADLLKLYVYGYFYRTRSSRLLEREAQRNLELIWLLKKLAPDFKTIADFRRDNGAGIQNLFRAFTRFCMGQGLITGALVAIDGSKFAAVNSKARNVSAAKLEQHLQALDARGRAYLAELDQNDQAEAAEQAPTAERIRTALKAIADKKVDVQARQVALQASGEKQLSTTDPDSRAMRSGSGHAVIGYNVQIAVDSAHKLIVDATPTSDCNDRHQLAVQALAVKELLGVETLDVVADKGYANGADYAQCQAHGITAYVPEIRSTPSPDHFGSDRFAYDAGTDCYRCPAGQRLHYRSTSQQQGRAVRRYKTDACGSCPLREQCTGDRRGRSIARAPFAEAVEAMAARTAARPERVQQRKCLVEHPFGTLKRAMNHGYFLTRRLPKVTTEIRLSALCYNLKRTMNILGGKAMMQALA